MKKFCFILTALVVTCFLVACSGSQGVSPKTIKEKKKIVADMIAADSSLAKMKMTMAAKPFKPREFKVTKAASLDYEVGDTVRHIKFGVGIVKDIVDGGRDYEVTVDFDKVGVKKMFAGFAKLKKL